MPNFSLTTTDQKIHVTYAPRNAAGDSPVTYTITELDVLSGKADVEADAAVDGVIHGFTITSDDEPGETVLLLKTSEDYDDGAIVKRLLYTHSSYLSGSDPAHFVNGVPEAK